MSTTKWVADPTHSEIGFKVKHMMFTNVSGKFENYDALIETDASDFSHGTVSFKADITSINTGNADRDEHLRSPDFFDSAQFPKIEFDGILEKDALGEYTISGDLKLHGISNAIKFPVEYSGILKDPWGNTKAGFTIDAKINRKNWGLNWNSVLETGGLLVGEEVRLLIELQLIKQQKPGL
jgi:polyisoprenoid-binding protein YceI